VLDQTGRSDIDDSYPQLFALTGNAITIYGERTPPVKEFPYKYRCVSQLRALLAIERDKDGRVRDAEHAERHIR
jgi:hypothetical protein